MRFCFSLLCLFLISCSDKSEIAFRENGHMYIMVKIDDSVSGNFMFDTGAGGLAFDSAFYFSNYNLNGKFYHSKLAGAGTRLQDILILEDSVRITAGKYSEIMYEPIIFNSKRIFGDSCDGIIGWEFFRDKILAINYEGKKLVSSAGLPDVSSYRKIPFQFVENKIILKGRLTIDNITINDDFFLDTGFNGGLALTSQTVNKYKLQYIKNKIPFYKKDGGIGGDFHGFKARAKSFSFEGFQIDSVPLICLQNESGGMAQPAYAGNIGDMILRKFELIIDFKNHTLYLKPSKQFHTPFQ